MVQEGIYEKFIVAFKKAMEEQIKTADGFTPGATQGPLINERAVEKVSITVRSQSFNTTETHVGIKHGIGRGVRELWIDRVRYRIRPTMYDHGIL